LITHFRATASVHNINSKSQVKVAPVSILRPQRWAKFSVLYKENLKYPNQPRKGLTIECGFPGNTSPRGVARIPDWIEVQHGIASVCWQFCLPFYFKSLVGRSVLAIASANVLRMARLCTHFVLALMHLALDR
jgi:hypothetical protein